MTVSLATLPALTANTALQGAAGFVLAENTVSAAAAVERVTPVEEPLPPSLLQPKEPLASGLWRRGAAGLATFTMAGCEEPKIFTCLIESVGRGPLIAVCGALATGLGIILGATLYQLYSLKRMEQAIEAVREQLPMLSLSAIERYFPTLSKTDEGKVLIAAAYLTRIFPNQEFFRIKNFSE